MSYDDDADEMHRELLVALRDLKDLMRAMHGETRRLSDVMTVMARDVHEMASRRR
jgi:hypothetical protein